MPKWDIVIVIVIIIVITTTNIFMVPEFKSFAYGPMVQPPT